MKLISVTCAGILAIAPATAAFAQDTYPDKESIAKTGPAPEKKAQEKGAQEKGGASGVVEKVLETVTGRPSSTMEEASQMKAPEEKPSPKGDTSYPDRGAIATTPSPSR
jgi:hypothetical protein